MVTFCRAFPNIAKMPKIRGFGKKKSATILYQSLRLDVVAVAGFEPTTFGL